MKSFLLKYLLLLTIISTSVLSYAQTPTDQDCLGAIPVCTGYYYQANSYVGTGNYPNEIPTTGGCPGNCLMSGEKNCVWYYVTVQSDGNMGFIVTPNVSSNDYDWAVYDLTNARCEDIYSQAAQLQVSCNYSGTSGNTGPNGGSNAHCQSAGGSPFNAMIPVQAGEIYVINISNFSTTGQSGYSIDFTISTAQIYDDVPPVVEEVYDELVSGCSTNEISILFSENVRCDRVTPSAFAISGPGGPYTVTDVYGVSCDVGGDWEKDFILTVDPAFASNGDYTLHVYSTFPGITDACDNPAVSHDVPFTLDLGAPTVNSLNLNITPATCGMDNGSITGVTANGQTTLNYVWKNSMGTIVGNTLDLIDVPAETYTLEVHDLMSCVTYGGPWTIDEFGSPDIIDDDISITSSNYGASNGSITGISVSSSFTIAEYVWINDQATVVGNDLDLIGVPTGYYTLEVIDENTCSALSGPYFVGEIGGPLSTNPSASPDVICSGEQVTLSPGAGGGSGSYSFTWTSTPAGFTSDLETPVVMPLETTTYHLQIFDGYITANGDVTVTVQPIPMPNAGTDQSIPHGIYTTLNGSANNGSGDYNYFWSPVDKLEDAAAQNPQTKNLYETTQFTLEVKDNETGCMSVEPDAVIVEVTGGFLSTNPSSYPDSTFCIGEEFTLTANGGGGSGTYSYTWSSDPALEMPDEQSFDISIDDPGTYNIEVIIFDGYNYASGSLAVTVNANPVIDLGPSVQTHCLYDTVSLDAGNPGSEYLWSNGAITQEIMVGTTGLGYVEQDYTVNVTSTAGCLASQQVTLIFDYDACLGIEESQFGVKLKVFPNPAEGIANIEIQDAKGVVSMQLLNATGRELYHKQFVPDAAQRISEVLDLSSYPAGIYLLTFDGEGLHRTVKLLKK